MLNLRQLLWPSERQLHGHQIRYGRKVDGDFPDVPHDPPLPRRIEVPYRLQKQIDRRVRGHRGTQREGRHVLLVSQALSMRGICELPDRDRLYLDQ